MEYTIFSKPNCAFCTKAKSLLDLKLIPYEEKMIDFGQGGENLYSLEDFKSTYPDVKSLPLVLCDGKIVGGYNDLAKLVN